VDALVAHLFQDGAVEQANRQQEGQAEAAGGVPAIGGDAAAAAQRAALPLGAAAPPRPFDEAVVPVAREPHARLGG